MRLKELRKANKKTQFEISQLLNIAQTTYSAYEIGISEPNVKTLCTLADYYDVSLDYLVDRNFNNEIGFLTNQEKAIVEIFRKMTDENKLRFYAQAQGIIITQN